MKYLIVTADDYGMSQAVNQAIQEGVDNGIITSTNVMMNMPFCDDVERIRNKDISIGIHWNLTCGKPILSPEMIPSIVNKDGSFYSITEFRYLFRKGKINELDVEKELVAQYDKYIQIWGKPDYWNSHENVHLWLKVFNVFLDTAAKLDIKKMRSHERIYVKSQSKTSSTSFIWKVEEPIKRFVFYLWDRKAIKVGIHSPDGKVCCLDERDVHNIKYLLSNIQWGSTKIAEFTIHPATKCDSEYFGNMTDNRIVEYHMVIGEQFHKELDSNKIQLVSFDEIL